MFSHLKCQHEGVKVILGILSDLAPWKGSCQCFLDDLPESRKTCFHQGETLSPGSTHIMQGNLFSLSLFLSKASGLSRGGYPSLKYVDTHALDYFRVIFKNSLLCKQFVSEVFIAFLP